MDPAFFASPKRKRDVDDDSSYSSPHAIRVKTDIAQNSAHDEDEANGSPRTEVAGQLQTLHLQQKEVALPMLFGRQSTGDAPHPDLAFTFDSRSIIEADGDREVKASDSLTPGTSLPRLGPLADTSRNVDAEFIQSTSNTRVTPPSTPPLKPTSPPSALRTISPLPIKSLDSSSLRMKSPPPPASQVRESFSPTPTPSSPNPLVWTDAEITGHNPTDPTDDGYGINGIGFKPTPAIAYARSQRRKQQVAEWKSREAREARAKRTERRRGILDGRWTESPKAPEDSQEIQTRKVRFAVG